MTHDERLYHFLLKLLTNPNNNNNNNNNNKCIYAEFSFPALPLYNVSSVIIHSIINTSFIYIKDFDTVSIGEEGIHHMPS